MSKNYKAVRVNTAQIGCQARPWVQTLGSYAFVDELASIMQCISSIGYAGFETALDLVSFQDPTVFAQVSEQAGGLQLSGAHASGRWWEDDMHDDVDSLVERAGVLPALGCERLVVSTEAMPTAPTDDQITSLAMNVGRLGRRCRELADVRVVYHNHAAELDYDTRVIEAILDRSDPVDVQLGADLGWVAAAGIDVSSFVERFGLRLAYLHLRDRTDNGRFVEIGEGILDYAAIFDALDAAKYEGWLITESEFGPDWYGATVPDETATIQLDGLYRALGAR